MEKICLVAILKDEESFLDEWIIYHRLLGFDHFYLYDDNPKFLLQDFTSPYQDFITVINWGKNYKEEVVGNQVNAYRHALHNYCYKYDWVAYIDGDEFIVLRKHESIKAFLNDYSAYSAVSLNWHMFGHNGYYENPQGLITTSLTRRMFLTDNDVKTISRPQSISEINYPHFFKYKGGLHVDCNKKIFEEKLYPGKSDIAHINHYICRSFKNWMNRVKRGDVNFSSQNFTEIHQWRLSEEMCLKQFVQKIALNYNEYIDEYMLKYKEILENSIRATKR